MRHLSHIHTCRQRGVASVEFALFLVPLLMIAFGALEYGRLLYQYDTVVKSVRSATRLIAQRNPDDQSSYTAALSEARCLAVYGVPQCTQTQEPLVPGLALSHVKICDRSSVTECAGLSLNDVKSVATGSDTGTLNLVVVRITGYQFSFLGLPFTGAGSSLVFQPIQSVMRQGL
ncbi:TadE-like [Oxalobacteraceae bacterium]